MGLGVRGLAAAAALVMGLTSAWAVVPSGAQEADAGEASGYIVRFADGVDPQERAQRVRRRGAAVGRVYSNVFPGFVAQLTDAQVAEVRRDPLVLSVEPDAIMRATDTQSDPPWGLDRIDQRPLPLSRTYSYVQSAGDSVTAYIVDTGVRSDHTQFSGRMLPGASFIYDGYGTDDGNGHGTHVAGTVAGSTYGVAKRALVVPVRVLGSDGSGSTSGVIAGLDWIVGHHGAGQRAVANLSLGGPASASLDAALERVVADGVPVVAAAGNDAVDACTQSPGRTAEAVTVGSTGSTDGRSYFSNHGACLDLFAPGSDVLSAGHASPTASATTSGTSMAAPHVAGAIAVLWAAQPSLTDVTVTSRVVGDATTNVVTDARWGSPNRLLHLVPPPGARPANDDLAGATAIDASVGSSTTGTNVAATKEAGEPAHAGNAGGRSVWWTFTAPVAGQMTLHTTGSSFDTVLAVYTGSRVGALTLVAADDDGGGSGFSSRVSFAAVAGTTYRVAVDGYGGAAGSIRLTWTGLGQVPGAPTDVVGVAGDGRVTLSWSAPTSDGGSPVTGYRVTPHVGGIAHTPLTFNSTATTQTVTGLTNGTAYTFKVAAINAAGTGPDSAASAATTPRVLPSYHPFQSWTALVARQYLDLLGRSPTASESTMWSTALGSGSKTKGDLVEALRRGPDHLAYVAPTARLYRAFLGRAPDAGGLKFWVAARRSGRWSLRRMADYFATSAEFKAKYGALTNRQFVVRIYTDVLGRTADAAGVDFWTAELDSGRRTRGTVMIGFSESREYQTLQAENNDVAIAYIFLLNRTPTLTESTDWVRRQRAGTPMSTLATALLSSTEYAARVAG